VSKTILAAIAALGIIGLTACDPATSSPADSGPADDSTYQAPYGAPGGMVLSPSGGIGIGIGGGAYINPATGGIGFGVPLS
jgi:hypothetical protein